MTRVLVSCIHLQRRLDDFAPDFEKLGWEVESPEVEQQLEVSWLVENLGRFDGMIAGDDPLTAEVLEAGAVGSLKAVVKWGIGVDAIDFDAARSLGIPIENTPGMFADEVADVAMGYIILLARRLHEIHESVKEGGWFKPPGASLRGKTVGLVGAGSIGQGIAVRAVAHGMNVIAFDPGLEEVDLEGVRLADLDETLREADFVVLACSLNDSNRGLLGIEQFRTMRRGAYLVNVARGPLVQEGALEEVLADGHLTGAALDVFEHEPFGTNHPLRRFEQCIWGSHNGSNTKEAVQRVNRITIDRLAGLLAGS